LGGAVPAVSAGVVIAPYSSGEVFALKVESGHPVWSDSLAPLYRVSALASLADIRGYPVIDHDKLIVISHAGRILSVDLRTGQRVWEQGFGGINMPWVAGDTIFILSSTNALIALARDDGHVLWIHSLPRWHNTVDRRGVIVWAGPVLAGGQLIVVGSEREGKIFSPLDGSEIRTFYLRGRADIPPIVANRTLYVLTSNGYLTAYR
jgi:outer membrane protein assembly factor BamB